MVGILSVGERAVMDSTVVVCPDGEVFGLVEVDVIVASCPGCCGVPGGPMFVLIEG